MAWWRKRRGAKQAAGSNTTEPAPVSVLASAPPAPVSVPSGAPPAHSATWRELDGGAYPRLLGSLADDPDVGRLLDLCADGTVPEEPPTQAAEALTRLGAKEDPSRPNSATFIAGIISALATLPAEQAVPPLVRLADQKSGLTAGSEPLARAAIRALGGVPGELVPPALHRLASESPLATLRRAAYAELKRRLRTLSDAPEWTVDTFGLDAGSRTRITVGSHHTAVVRIASGGRVHVVYHDANGRALTGKPTASTLHPTAMSDVTDLANTLRRAVRSAKTRLESAQKERREIPTPDWVEHYMNHPVTGRLARTLLWELSTGSGDWHTGLPRRVEDRWCLLTPAGERLVPGDDDLLRVVASGNLTGEEIKAWTRFLAKARIRPVLPQIDLR